MSRLCNTSSPSMFCERYGKGGHLSFIYSNAIDHCLPNTVPLTSDKLDGKHHQTLQPQPHTHTHTASDKDITALCTNTSGHGQIHRTLLALVSQARQILGGLNAMSLLTTEKNNVFSGSSLIQRGLHAQANIKAQMR